MTNERRMEHWILENCGGKPKYCPLTEYPKIKESKGRGKPEYIFRHKKIPTVLLVECKTETINHQSEKLDKPAFNNVDGLLYYAKYFKNEFDVLGLAVSEEYFPIEAKSSQESLDIERIRENADKLHDIIYQGLGFTEKEKPLFISACLIALKNEDFRNEYTKKTTPKSLVSACKAAIETEIEKVQEEEKVSDVIGEFYHEFLKYSTGDGKGLGIVLTPSHIAELFCELALKMLGRESFSEEDKILDVCCGTGSFLVSALNKGANRENIYDCFDKEVVKIVAESNCNIAFLNPPYSQKKKKESEGKAEIEFIEHSLDLLKKDGIAIAIVPLSTAIGTKYKEQRERIMKKHTLEAVMTMPRDEKYFEIYSSKRGVILDDYEFSHVKSKNAVPVITSSGQNNGFVGFITKNDEEVLHSSNSITIAKDGTHIAFSFFQPEDFYANPLVFILKVKCGSNRQIELISFFICSIIKMEHPKYSYGRKLNIDNFLGIKILLPADEKGEPN
ncbi:S-adenosyl-L-methionine-dependent methyltransferase [Glomus cerebriforme]|uniref:site-specific DNA-methyltransferase (adenine-specific) n=1 Tax=Glomus cerebriforme TaxID=658196 RepID=A0A397S9C7_9GLOM|nr:S-adenosyl-L-methionine-dependent methyltransferase [Glomus cerebriforme]